MKGKVTNGNEMSRGVMGINYDENIFKAQSYSRKHLDVKRYDLGHIKQ